MVSLNEIRAANAKLPTSSLTAVFVGATSGIGLGAIEALLQNTASSKLFIIGRSQSKFAPELARLQNIDTCATITFIEAQVSLLKEVERVCSVITSQTTSLNLLWLSQGGLSLSAHALTQEGIFEDYAITYYSRMLFTHKLAPLLSAATDARVLSILAAGAEGPINTTDPGLHDPQNYGFIAAQRQGVTMTSLALRELAAQHPGTSFIHTNPGMVRTAVHEKWAQTMTGVLLPLRWLLRRLLIPVMHYFSFTAEEAGQTGFFEATDERFGCRREGGRNFWRLWEDGEEVGARGEKVLRGYESDGTQGKLWEHTVGVFERVLER